MIGLHNDESAESRKDVKQGLKAKPISLKSQIIAAIWIAGWSAFKFASDSYSIKINDVIFSGLGIAACFSPVYLSIVMDKIKEIRFGGTTQ
ncbi:hypothetical protein [Treponema sp. Marseille-Q4130]|uniref:hypothetical protein n=1 Tax=Treponema sp. Marseille-Q4130 TaxID=2766702 RepID=UPI001652620E|nr:hypothetical protein [Treponema sp. Marseille-Q4130]MBC6720321.1 hypothetical protein [Treponema sp. Marseille-Q4130]